MLSTLFFTAALAISAFGLPSGNTNPSQLLKRAPAQVITKCTVPNTAALTFVSLDPTIIHIALIVFLG